MNKDIVISDIYKENLELRNAIRQFLEDVSIEWYSSQFYATRSNHVYDSGVASKINNLEVDERAINAFNKLRQINLKYNER